MIAGEGDVRLRQLLCSRRCADFGGGDDASPSVGDSLAGCLSSACRRA